MNTDKNVVLISFLSDERQMSLIYKGFENYSSLGMFILKVCSQELVSSFLNDFYSKISFDELMNHVDKETAVNIFCRFLKSRFDLDDILYLLEVN